MIVLSQIRLSLPNLVILSRIQLKTLLVSEGSVMPPLEIKLA